MKKKIVVFGSFMTDLTGLGERFPLPGETISGIRFKPGQGGKGSNQAVAAHRAGADVTMIAKLGEDVFADFVRSFYQSEGLSTDYLMTQPGGQTGAAIILVDQISAQNMIMIFPGSNDTFDDSDIRKVEDLIKQADYLLVQNEVNRDALEKVITLAADAGIRVVFNPAPARELSEELYAKIYCITPNETEAQTLTGIPVDSEKSAERAAECFFKKGVQNVVITMGSAGVFVSDGERGKMLAPLAVKAVDTTGAGDAFNGALIAAMAEGKDLFEAAKYANVGGALSVTKFGTAPAMAYRREIDDFIDKM